MRFIGENEMILNASTLRLALERWINAERINQTLEITSVLRTASGGVKIRFQPQRPVPKAAPKPTEEMSPNER